MSYWSNKVVLITGGSAGFGLELAKAWAARGARLVLVGRNEETLSTAKQALVGFTTEVFTVAADVTKDTEVCNAVQATVDHFGQLDVLVNCAGKSMRKAVTDTTAADFDAAWQVNFLSAVRCTQAALPHLIRSKGQIVLIGSLASKSAARFLGPYPASKFPLAAYAQQLRLELTEQGVQTLLVCPGPIRRADAETRYAAESTGLPAHAAKPGGGVKLKGLDASKLAQEVIHACETHTAELVRPRKARLLFILSAISPKLGDWLVRKMTGGE